MKRPAEPARSGGGTFIRNRAGELIQFVPPTRPFAGAPVAEWTPPDSAIPAPAPAKSRRRRGRKE
jgi:hypothetical protein